MTVLSVTKKLSLVAFAGDMHFSQLFKDKMFKDHLNTRIKSMVAVHRLRILRDVADVSRITKKDRLEAQKHSES